MTRNLIALGCFLFAFGCAKKEAPKGAEPAPQVTGEYQEQYRPQIHFSPPDHWMNDPNGLVYHDGEYHLFYQHYPKDIVWGPMHWGHAVTKDLVHWTNLPIALYPDSLGMIFSGSAVVDKDNTAGFGSNAMVSMFTYHNAEREKLGKNDHETQGIAYSVDNGRTWTKYKDNPVINNKGMRDFRDPKVMWYEPSKQWIVVLAVGDHTEFYGSKDLKAWTKLSEFGQGYGSHGGVWECPDLFPLTIEGEKTQKWIHIVNINPGGPNGGSAIQYFIGNFDGKKFTSDNPKSKILWLDYGPDNYAGITWANSPGDRKVFIGWMSNWEYAQQVPTSTWRSASTVIRELKLVRANKTLVVSSMVVPEFVSSGSQTKSVAPTTLNDSLPIADSLSTGVISGSLEAKDWRIKLSNSSGEHVLVGFEKAKNQFYIDRKASGDTTFSKSFANMITAPRIANDQSIPFTLVIDVASVELFFDSGATVMTAVFFPKQPLNKVQIDKGSEPVKIEGITTTKIQPIW